MRTNVLLADDHRVVLDGYDALLASESDLAVVGRATDGLETIAQTERLHPDILVLDLMMPGLSGLEVLRRLKNQVPPVRVVVVSMHETLAYVSEAMRQGASGYVLKQAPANEVLRAIRSVREGKTYLSPPLSEDALIEYDANAKRSNLGPIEALSGREREVLQLAAEGWTNAEIGDKLGIGRRTVETHRANLMRKLALESHAELVKLALKNGLVSLD